MTETEPKQTSQLCTWSMILGILSIPLVATGFMPITAFVVGCIAYNNIDEKTTENFWMVRAGLWCSGSVLAILGILIFYAMMNRPSY